MPEVLKMLCIAAGEAQTLGGNAQTLEDEANADVADTLIDDALGELLLCCNMFLQCTCPDVKKSAECWAWLQIACASIVCITGCVCSARFVRQQIVWTCHKWVPSN